MFAVHLPLLMTSIRPIYSVHKIISGIMGHFSILTTINKINGVIVSCFIFIKEDNVEMLDEMILKRIFESFNEFIIHYTSNIGLVYFDT